VTNTVISTTASNRANRSLSWIIGSGVALFPIHNAWLTKLATNSRGEVFFFLPALGMMLILIGSWYLLLNEWKTVKETIRKDKHIVIPLLVILAAIGLSGATAADWQHRLAPLMMGVTLFTLYLSARILGRGIFLPLSIGAGLAILGVVVHAVLFLGAETGGFVFGGNYDIATGYILLGAAVFIHKWRWLLASLAVVASLLTGASEAIFAIGILSLVVLSRRDLGRRTVIPFGVLLVVLTVMFSLGRGQQLYSRPAQAANPQTWGDTNSVVGNRWSNAVATMGDIRPLGTGYTPTEFGRRFTTRDGTITEIVHNVPLVIVQQMGWPGIAAAVAWLWVSLWCLLKTRWKYAWSLILILSVFDHFTWTQMGPLFWVLAGVSVSRTGIESGIGADIESDLVFRQKVTI